jgi:hypothetical protein
LAHSGLFKNRIKFITSIFKVDDLHKNLNFWLSLEKIKEPVSLDSNRMLELRCSYLHQLFPVVSRIPLAILRNF